MNGVGLDLSGAPESSQIERFLNAFKELSAGADRLREWRALSVRKNIERFQFGAQTEVQLLDYLALAAPSREQKAVVFDSLLDWLASESVSIGRLGHSSKDNQ